MPAQQLRTNLENWIRQPHGAIEQSNAGHNKEGNSRGEGLPRPKTATKHAISVAIHAEATEISRIPRRRERDAA